MRHLNPPISHRLGVLEFHNACFGPKSSIAVIRTADWLPPWKRYARRPFREFPHSDLAFSWPQDASRVGSQ